MPAPAVGGCAIRPGSLRGEVNKDKPTAKLLLGQGKVGSYLDEHPESSRRLQAEFKDVSLLSGGLLPPPTGD